MSTDSEISMKVPKYRDKFLRGIYLHSICKRKNETMQTSENLREKSAEGKNHNAKRERLQGVLATLLQIQLSRVQLFV